jgi:predicted acetyltransferase
MSLSPSISIGAVRPDELESLLDLICEAFVLPLEPARDIYYKDPYLNLNNKRVLRVDGQIVSCLTVADTTVGLNGSSVRVGGIAGVATRITERGKGYAGLLLRDTLDFLAAEGYVLSALIPYSSHFYRRLGWELCGTACRYVTAPMFLPSAQEARHVRPARKDDLPALEKLYRTDSLLRTFWGQRDGKRWEYLWTHVKQCHVYHEQDAPISGYVLSDLRQNPPYLDEGAPLPTLRVLELVGFSAAARRGLLAHLSAQTGVRDIEFCAEWGTLALWGLFGLMGTGIGEEILANVEVIPMLMARIVHFEPLLRAAVRYYPRYKSEFAPAIRFVLHDPLCSPEPEPWTLSGDGSGSATVQPSSEADLRFPCVTGDVRAWAQVLTGFRSGADAVSQGLLHVSGSLPSEQLDALLPRREPFLPLPDHF